MPRTPQLPPDRGGNSHLQWRNEPKAESSRKYRELLCFSESDAMIEFCRCFARRVKPVEIPLAYPARQKYSAKPFYLLGRSTVHGVVFDIFSRNPVGWISPRLREAQSASVIHHLHCGSMVDYAALIHPTIHPNTTTPSRRSRPRRRRRACPRRCRRHLPRPSAAADGPRGDGRDARSARSPSRPASRCGAPHPGC